MERENEINDFIYRCREELKDALAEQEKIRFEKYIKEYNKPHNQEAKKRHAKSEKGKYTRSKVNFNRRVRFKDACDELTWEERIEIGKFYKNCPKGYEVDHIYPIAKGGKHRLSNLQYLTKSENARKKDKLDYMNGKEIN